MLLFTEAYNVIDIADRNRQATVVVEATSRAEVSDYIAANKLAECDVFKEHGEELYRGICTVTVAGTKTSTDITYSE